MKEYDGRWIIFLVPLPHLSYLKLFKIELTPLWLKISDLKLVFEFIWIFESCLNLFASFMICCQNVMKLMKMIHWGMTENQCFGNVLPYRMFNCLACSESVSRQAFVAERSYRTTARYLFKFTCIFWEQRWTSLCAFNCCLCTCHLSGNILACPIVSAINDPLTWHLFQKFFIWYCTCRLYNWILKRVYADRLLRN